MVDPDAVFSVTITESGLHITPAGEISDGQLDEAIDEAIAEHGTVYKRLSQ
ncbi:MAG: hypothetical protein LUE17_01245 [Planctomycetaceae bacterium]|nr:hypothetical protein [Planctomycetaceae bacterium]